MVTVGAFPPSQQQEHQSQDDASQRLLELEKQRKQRRDEILAKRKDMINAARGTVALNTPDPSHPTAVNSILAAILAPKGDGSPTTTDPTETITTNNTPTVEGNPTATTTGTVNAAAVRNQRLAYFDKLHKSKQSGDQVEGTVSPQPTEATGDTQSGVIGNTSDNGSMEAGGGGDEGVTSIAKEGGGGQRRAGRYKQSSSNIVNSVDGGKVNGKTWHVGPSPTVPSSSPLRQRRGQRSLSQQSQSQSQSQQSEARYDSDEEEALREMTMAPRPGYKNGVCVDTDGGSDGEKVDAALPLSPKPPKSRSKRHRHRRHHRDASPVVSTHGDDSGADENQGEPADNFVLPVMYPPGSKDRHKQPVTRRRDVIAAREREQYDRVNRLTYGKPSPYALPVDMPTLPVTRGVRSLLRYAEQGKSSAAGATSDNESHRSETHRSDTELAGVSEDERYHHQLHEQQQQQQPTAQHHRSRKKKVMPTMSKSDRQDPFAIIKRYELRAQLDRERRAQHRHTDPTSGDHGEEDGDSDSHEHDHDDSGVGLGIALSSSSKRQASLRASQVGATELNATATTTPNVTNMTINIPPASSTIIDGPTNRLPSTPIMLPGSQSPIQTTARTEYTEVFESEGDSPPVGTRQNDSGNSVYSATAQFNSQDELLQGTVVHSPRPISEPVPVSNQPVLSPVLAGSDAQVSRDVTTMSAKKPTKHGSQKSLSELEGGSSTGKRASSNSKMNAVGPTPQLPAQLLASLRDSGRVDSGFNLRMALRSFTHAWTNVDVSVPKPALDRRKAAHSGDGVVDKVVRMPAIRSWSNGSSTGVNKK